MFIFTHQKAGHGLLAQVAEGLTEVDDEGVVSPECGLDYGPVRNSAVTRHGVEIQISVQVIRGPLHLDDTESCQLNHLKRYFLISFLKSIVYIIYLPDNVSVLPILGVRLVVGDSDVLLQVVDSNVTIVQSHHQHVRVLQLWRTAG